MTEKELTHLSDKHLVDIEYILDYDEDEMKANDITLQQLSELTLLDNEYDSAVFDWKETIEMAKWIAKSAKKYNYFYSVDDNGDCYVVIASNFLIPNATLMECE